MKDYQRFAGCLAAVLLVTVFYLATLRSGQPWGDDFAMYIHEAKNIAGGIPLSNTGYIYNPSMPEVGPRLFPPIFPVLLVPGYVIGGLTNLTPMKIEVVLFFVGLLVLLWCGLGHDLPSLLCVAMLAIVGFNPLFWNFKDIIVSDIPFTFLLYLTFILADRLVSDSEKASGTRWQILALGGLVYLCYGTRTVATVLFPGLVILAAISWKRGGQRVAWAVGLALVPCLIQQKLLGGYLSSYGDQLRLSPGAEIRAVIDNISDYTWHLASFWANPYSKWLRDLLFIGATLLASLAYFRRLLSSPRIYEIFLPLYLGIVIVWPYSGGFRYLIPVIPLYVFYVLEGIDTLSCLLGPRLRTMSLVLLISLTAGSYATEFGHTQFGAFRDGVGTDESLELFSFIQSHTAPNDVFVFQKPRALALFTGRSASVYSLEQTPAEHCSYFKLIGATYLIEDDALDDKSFDDFLHRQFSKKEPSFRNAVFRVLHLVPADLEQCAEGKVITAPSAPSAPSVPLRP